MARTIRVPIVGDTSQYKRALAQAESRTAKFGAIAKTALIGGAAAGMYALGKAARIGFDEFNNQQRVAAQTLAVLKSTGGAANVTAGHVEELGKQLMLLSGIDDEVIKSGENILLTFTKVRNEVGKGNDIFDQATKLALDMSTALGKDLQGSVLQLGKALQNPTVGMTALRRSGVSFTQAQTDLINKLYEEGKVLKAQKLILAEVSKEFAGSAEAAGETFGGQLNILRERLNNFLGDLTGKAIPILQRFAKWLDPRVTAALAQVRQVMAVWRQQIDNVTAVLERHQSEVNKVIKVLGFLGRVLGVVIKIQLFWAKVIGTIWVHEIEIALVAIQKITAFVRILGSVAQKVGRVVQTSFGIAASAVRVFIAPIITAINAVQTLIGWINKIPSIPFGGGGGPGPGSTGGRFGEAPAARALGGSISRGRAYMVGERGPELFMAGASGGIVSNQKLRDFVKTSLWPILSHWFGGKPPAIGIGRTSHANHTKAVMSHLTAGWLFGDKASLRNVGLKTLIHEIAHTFQKNSVWNARSPFDTMGVTGRLLGVREGGAEAFANVTTRKVMRQLGWGGMDPSSAGYGSWYSQAAHRAWAGRGRDWIMRGQFGFDRGGVVPGRRGTPQLIMAHGGETVLPTHRSSSSMGSVQVVVVGGERQAIRWFNDLMANYSRQNGGRTV